MNKIKKAVSIVSAAVLCAIPLAPSVSNNVSFFNNTAITASASCLLDDFYPRPSAKYNGCYNPNVMYEEVKWIQIACNVIASAYGDYNLSTIKVDGYYGNKTKNAVRRIQELTFFFKDRNKNRTFVAGGITADGLAGKITVAKMDKLINYAAKNGGIIIKK